MNESYESYSDGKFTLMHQQPSTGIIIFLDLAVFTATAKHPLFYRIKCMSHCCIILGVQCSHHKLLKHNKPVAVSRLHFFMSFVGSKLFAFTMRPGESGFSDGGAIKIIALENALTSHMSHISVLETRIRKGQRVLPF